MQDKDDLFERRLNDYISGMITGEEMAELFSLVRSSELYRLQYDKAAKLHALLHAPALEREKDESFQRFRERVQGMDGKKKNRFVVWTRIAVAAILLMALTSVVSVYTYQRVTSHDLLCETVVPLGSQARIMLPDSSIVVLNSGSVLKYPVSFGNVYLAGQGYFEVTKDKAKVFQVYAGETKVKVTGTVFNVRAYPDDVQTEVDLIKGGVNVSVGDKNVFLKPNERAIYNRESGSLVRSGYDTSKSAVWTTGKLSFVNASFRDILKEIERKYNVKIHIMSRQIENESFSGTIHTGMTLQEVFNFIDVDKKYRFDNSGNTIILRDR